MHWSRYLCLKIIAKLRFRSVWIIYCNLHRTLSIIRLNGLSYLALGNLVKATVTRLFLSDHSSIQISHSRRDNCSELLKMILRVSTEERLSCVFGVEAVFGSICLGRGVLQSYPGWRVSQSCPGWGVPQSCPGQRGTGVPPTWDWGTLLRDLERTWDSGSIMGWRWGKHPSPLLVNRLTNWKPYLPHPSDAGGNDPSTKYKSKKWLT